MNLTLSLCFKLWKFYLCKCEMDAHLCSEQAAPPLAREHRQEVVQSILLKVDIRFFPSLAWAVASKINYYIIYVITPPRRGTHLFLSLFYEGLWTELSISKELVRAGVSSHREEFGVCWKGRHRRHRPKGSYALDHRQVDASMLLK